MERINSGSLDSSGHNSALALLAQLMNDGGNPEIAHRIKVYGLEPDGRIAMPWSPKIGSNDQHE